MSLYSAANQAAFDRAQEAWDNATPPEPRDAPCRNCSHAGEGHEEDGRCLNDVRVQRWTRDGDPRPYWITVPCDCEGYEARTADDDIEDGQLRRAGQ